MLIQEYEPGLAAEWDDFVRRHPFAGYGHLAANFELAAATPALRDRSLIVREGRGILAVLPLFEERTRLLRAIPVGSLVSGAFFPAGPLISTNARGKAETNALALLLEAVRERAKARGVDHVLIGYPNVTAGQPTMSRVGYSPLLHHGYRARPGVGLMIDLTQTVEQLGAGRKSGCRQTIAKAQAAGAVAAPLVDRDQWLRCHEMNEHTLGPLALSVEQMAAMWDRFIAPGDATAFAVHVDGAIAAVTTVIRCCGSAYYWHGWRAEGSLQGASHLGLWSAILASKNAGCRAFELGSVEFENARNIGISQFKQSFGGTPFQTMNAELDMKPVKSAALALAAAGVATLRQRRKRPATPAESSAPMTAAVART